MQHVLILVGRLVLAFLFTFGPVYGLKERFGFSDDENTITYSHFIFLLISFIVELQFLYGIAHLIQIVYPTEDFVKSRKLSSYILEVLVDLCLVVPTVILLNKAWSMPVINIYGTYYDNMDKLKLYFGVQGMNDYIILCMVPQCVLYIIQLSVLIGSMRIELQLHHMIALMYVFVLLSSPVSSGLLLMGLVQLIFALLEFPLFLGLILYRLCVNGKVVTDTNSSMWKVLERLFSALRFYWGVTRIVLVIMLVLVFVKHFESFSLFVQIVYPIAIAVQVGTMGLTQKEIHGLHARMSKNQKLAKAYEENGKMPSTRSMLTTEEGRRSMMSVRNISEQ